MNRPISALAAPLLFLSLALAGGCQSALHRYEYNEPKMGAGFRIVLYARDDKAADRGARAAFSRVDQLDAILNDYSPDSEVSRLSQRTLTGSMTEPVKVSPELFFVLQRSYEVADRTGGAFDVTVGPFTHLWRRSRDLGQLPAPRRIEDARAAVGYRRMRLDPKAKTVQLLAPHMRLDVAGIAVGYVVDESLQAMRKAGVSRALIDAGGDLGMTDPPPGAKGWRVGLQSLQSPDQKTGDYVELRNAFISTAGDAYRFVEIDGKRYSHIVDPRTGLGLTNRIGVTAIARDGITCDWLDDAVAVLGREKGTALADSIPGAAARITTIDDAGRITVSDTSRFGRYLTDPSLGRGEQESKIVRPISSRRAARLELTGFDSLKTFHQTEQPRMPQRNENNRGSSILTSPSRRDFMRTGTAAAVGAAIASTYAFPSGVFAKASNTIKVGLIGCGGRGGGAAVNALTADEGAELVAMGDMFADKLEKAHDQLSGTEVGDRVADAKAMKKFVGWDAYKGVIDASDIVLLTTPPHFRPMHLRAAIEAGKHVFCEKPVATDVPNVKKVIEACKLAKEKNLNVVSGLCYRYDQAKIDTVNKIHDGGIGDLINLQTSYNTTGLWMNPRQPAWDDMQWQLRNWLYFRWLSGDFVVEQSIHSIDKMMWIMKDEPPVKVSAAGGRVQRTSPEYGNIYDHYNSVIEWKGGVKCFQSSRQWDNTDTSVADFAYGTQGMADIHEHAITGKTPWSRKPAPVGMYDAEHVALFKAIRGKLPTINNGDYMTKSTLVAMMCRMSAYTGKTIFWDEEGAKANKVTQNAAIILNSTEDMSPAKYEFGPLEVAPIPVPGKTKFI